jgi:hypothetical protein
MENGKWKMKNGNGMMQLEQLVKDVGSMESSLRFLFGVSDLEHQPLW